MAGIDAAESHLFPGTDLRVLRLPFGPLEANAWLVMERSRSVLIDPCIALHHMPEGALDGSLPVTLLLATHGHFDHVMTVSSLRSRLSASFRIHPEDSTLLGDPIRNGAVLLFENTAFPPPDATFRDGDRFHLDGSPVSTAEREEAAWIQVLHTPGHTSGSCCFALGIGRDETLAIFTGDTLFRLSCGRTDLPGGSASRMRASLARLAEWPGDPAVFPGHGEPTTLGQERERNRWLRASLRRKG